MRGFGWGVLGGRGGWCWKVLGGAGKNAGGMGGIGCDVDGFGG
ncbi:MAG TPA: hypothetical protein VHS59_05480 [Bacillota bacterium]|nr:hypothetical protein [Bacillota bacterium]